MDYGPKSISDHIESLARLTGAPRAFVQEVRELFERKGIPLSSDGTPYVRALEEAFTREHTIRSGASRGPGGFDRSRGEFARAGRRWVQRVAGTRAADEARPAARAERPEPVETIELARPDPRGVVLGFEREGTLLVPGPDLLQ